MPGSLQRGDTLEQQSAAEREYGEHEREDEPRNDERAHATTWEASTTTEPILVETGAGRTAC